MRGRGLGHACTGLTLAQRSSLMHPPVALPMVYLPAALFRANLEPHVPIRYRLAADSFSLKNIKTFLSVTALRILAIPRKRCFSGFPPHRIRKAQHGPSLQIPKSSDRPLVGDVISSLDCCCSASLLPCASPFCSRVARPKRDCPGLCQTHKTQPKRMAGDQKTMSPEQEVRSWGFNHVFTWSDGP